MPAASILAIDNAAMAIPFLILFIAKIVKMIHVVQFSIVTMPA